MVALAEDSCLHHPVQGGAEKESQVVPSTHMRRSSSDVRGDIAEEYNHQPKGEK